MVIKSFVGSSVAEALRMIRSELGPRAVVLKTRTLRERESGSGRRMVEITACLERPTTGELENSMLEKSMPEKSQFNKNRSARSMERSARLKRLKDAVKDEQSGAPVEKMKNTAEEERAKDATSSGPGAASRHVSIDIGDTEEFARRLEEKLDLILDTQLNSMTATEYAPDIAKIAELLAAHDVPERFMQPLIKRVIERKGQQSGVAAIEALEEILVDEFAVHCLPDFTLKPGDVALFIGPSGSGKTSALGKFAVDLIFNKKLKTELSTLDDFRVAAHEEIAGYSEALGAGLVDVQACVRDGGRNRGDTVTLIDCHSNIYDQSRYMALIDRVQAIKPTVTFMTISALTRSADLIRLLKRFGQLNPTHLIVTHTDLTDAVGGIYVALNDRGLKLASLTNSPGSVGELLTPDPASMARRMMRRPQ